MISWAVIWSKLLLNYVAPAVAGSISAGENWWTFRIVLGVCIHDFWHMIQVVLEAAVCEGGAFMNLFKVK